MATLDVGILSCAKPSRMMRGQGREYDKKPDAYRGAPEGQTQLLQLNQAAFQKQLVAADEAKGEYENGSRNFAPEERQTISC